MRSGSALVVVVALVAGAVGGCAHGKKAGSADDLRDTSEKFHELVRWRDYTGAALLVGAEQRKTFDRVRREAGDERDLSITDYELLQADLDPGGTSAVVRSRISWVRLPSVS